MAARLSPEQVDEIEVADKIDPIDESWLQHATVGAYTCNLLAAVLDELRRFNGISVTERTPIEPEDMIPALPVVREMQEKAKRAAQRARDMSPEELRAAHKKQFGSR